MGETVHGRKEMEQTNSILSSKKLRWVTVNFVDVFGRHRTISLPKSSFTKGEAWEGVSFDGSSVGLAKIHNSDMYAIPDPESIKLDPFSKGTTALVMAFSGHSKGELHCPRSALKDVLDEYAKRGLVPLISPEMEFYVFDSIDQAVLENDFMGADIGWQGKNVMHSLLGYYKSDERMSRPKRAYLSPRHEDPLWDYREKLSESLLEMGYDVRYHHHEGGRRQIEVETGYYPGLESMDYVVNFKYAAKNLGRDFGLLPTFMPKPIASDAGSGMHLHFMMKKGQRFAFNTNGDLSELAMQFIAGLLKHARALCTFTNPTINSYRRLKPGFEAPMTITWSRGNRSALIRVPANSKGNKCNLEIRNPDASCNPYLATTAVLTAGLDGIKRKLEPPKEAQGNLYKENNAPLLPSTLEEAIEATLSDKVILSALPESLLNTYIEAKEREISDYRKHVPVWDFNNYFDV